MNEVLVHTLEQLGPLSDQERPLVENAAFAVRQVEDGQNIVREGDRPAHCPLLLDGFACRHKTLKDGQRQITAFHVLCDLTSLLLGTRDHSIGTLTPVRVALIPYAAILGWTKSHPGLGQLLWRATLVSTVCSSCNL